MNKEKQYLGFSDKLIQKSTIDYLRNYVFWMQGKIKRAKIIHTSPLSINLDPTTLCNFNCEYCVDKKIIHKNKSLDIIDFYDAIGDWWQKDLKSIIFVGGGEPSLNSDFSAMINVAKLYKLQTGIITNGVLVNDYIGVLDRLQNPDWIRFSIDAGCDETYKRLHKTKQDFISTLKNGQEIKKYNPDINLGFSFLVLPDINEKEISMACKYAKEYGFDYISFKAYLTKVGEKEEMFWNENCKDNILEQLNKGKEIFKDIVLSSNLQGFLEGRPQSQTKTKICHMQYFHTVITPKGSFNCPAFRGYKNSKLTNVLDADLIRKRTLDMIDKFDCEKECSSVCCFYYDANNFIQQFIDEKINIDKIKPVEDFNTFI